MNIEKSLYLALNNLYRAIADEGIGWPAHSAMTVATYEANKAIAQFELELGPLPDWATAHNIAQEPVLYAQLYTKNGRQRGNGMIYHIGHSGTTFGIITDMGNTSTLNREELLGIYEIGDFVLNEEGYEKRKRQRDEYIEPLEHD